MLLWFLLALALLVVYEIIRVDDWKRSTPSPPVSYVDRQHSAAEFKASKVGEIVHTYMFGMHDGYPVVAVTFADGNTVHVAGPVMHLVDEHGLKLSTVNIKSRDDYCRALILAGKDAETF